MQRRLALGLALTSLAACYGRVTTRVDASVSDVPAPQDLADIGPVGDAPAGPTLPGGDCDPLDPSECALPWPSNHYLRADPSRPTGFTLTFGATSIPPNLAESHADPTSLRVLDGYGVGTPILVHFRDIDVSAMADEEHIDRSLAADAPVMLFEVANGALRRVPYWVELDNAVWEPNASERMLFVRPAVILKEATRYVVAFRNLRTTAGAAIAPSAAFVKLRDRTAMGDPALAPRVARFEEMFNLLTAAGVPREGLTLAWDWNTASSEALHGRLLRMRDEALRVVGERGPELFVSSVTRYGRPGADAGATDPNIALAIEGDIRAPNFMRSRRAGGFEVFEIVTDANGRPTINTAEPDVPLHFWIRIPHSALSGAPHGLVQYGHGLLGSGEEVEAGYNGQIANDHNLIFFASNLVGFAEEDVGSVLASVRDVGNFQFVAQKQHQGLVNWAVLARAVRARLGDIPEVRAAGVQVNREELFYSGISQGGIFGATYLAMSPDITRGHLGVPGNNYNILLRRSVDFEGYGNMIRGQYPSARHQALGLAYIQLHWDATDPVSYLRHITAAPFPGNTPHHGLWAPARGDYQVSVMTNEMAARSELGISLMANYDRDRTPWGITPQAYPHRGSGVVLYSYSNPWPAPGNHPPARDSLGDPHGRPRREAWHQRQMVTFFRTGEITDVCGGNGCTPGLNRVGLRTAIVLGAGPSGLATSACLLRRGVQVTTLEARDAVGSSWRRHYRRLHLHTVKEHSALPGMPFGDSVARYPSRADVVAYLDAYAARFGVTPRFGQRAHDARRIDGRWVVTTDDDRFEADALVVATGYNREPVIPAWPGREGFPGEVVHASQYADGAAYRGRSALVVGVGNTGAELALDLWEHGARVTLCARSPQHVVPRDVFGVPAQLNSLHVMRHLPLPLADALARRLSRMILGDLGRWGLPAPTTGMLSDVVQRGHIPMLDIGTVALIKQGAITVVPGIERSDGGRVRFVDGRAMEFDAIVLATGYRAALGDVLADAAEVTDARGYPRWHGARVPGHPGLYFVGYRNPLTGALHDIALESERVASLIAGAP